MRRGGPFFNEADAVLGKFDDLTRKDLLECAAVNNIKNASEIIDQICEAASGWIIPHLLLNL